MIVLEGPLDDWEETQRTSRLTSDVSLTYDTVISRMFATPDEIGTRAGVFYETLRREGVAV